MYESFTVTGRDTEIQNLKLDPTYCENQPLILQFTVSLALVLFVPSLSDPW